MPSHIVTFKESATDDDIQKIKDDIVNKGGQITHEYNLIKGFAFSQPEVSTFSVETLSAHEHVDTIEADQEVRTQ